MNDCNDNFMSMKCFEESLEQFRNGKMIVLFDHEDRENEGDLVIAAQHATSEVINFMTRYGRGLVCVPLEEKRIEELCLTPMVSDAINTSKHNTSFTISVGSKDCVGTGISTQDRADTIAKLIDPNTKALDLTKPGHVFPLKEKTGGVLVRAGHTEGSLDLCRLTNLYPAAVICEIMNEDGTMSRLKDLRMFAKKHNLAMISISQIIEYRRKKEKLIKRVSEANLPTQFGVFKIISYENILTKQIHIALVMGNPENCTEPILTRVHSQCLTGDVFYSMRCDCGNQLNMALKMIEKKKIGVCLYMNQEGRGIGLHNKLKAYQLQDMGFDTVEANHKLGFQSDLREYGIGAQILKDLNLHDILLMTNNPQKIIGLAGYDIKITERIPIIGDVNPFNKHYLKIKADKLGHYLS